MGRYRLGPVYWGNDAGAYVPLAREQDKKANPELHFHRLRILPQSEHLF